MANLAIVFVCSCGRTWVQKDCLLCWAVLAKFNSLCRLLSSSCFCGCSQALKLQHAAPGVNTFCSPAALNVHTLGVLMFPKSDEPCRVTNFAEQVQEALRDAYGDVVPQHLEDLASEIGVGRVQPR
eukprot:s1021_g13.t1